MEVQSYIKNPTISLTDDFMNHPEDFFVSIDSVNLQNIADKLDSEYIEGALILTHYGKTIIGFELWDLVGVMWAYLMNAVEKLMSSGMAHMYLPDQPIRIDMEIQGKEHVKLQIGSGEFGNYVLPRDELLYTLVNGAEHFFLTVKMQLQIDKFDYHIEQTKNIKKMLY